ncbi:MAG: hypothetical protein MUE40_14060 [Anaerolineae bacterium]|nr:hypothetical protein [Anaerolineae bacterium]
MADRWSGLLVPAALLAYLLPWVVNPGAALTPGAYDLAEWVSLTPMARGQSPVLLTPLLLRLPLLINCRRWNFWHSAMILIIASRRRWRRRGPCCCC